MLVFFAMVVAVFRDFGVDAEPDAQLSAGIPEREAIVCVLLIICLYYFDLYDSLVLSNPREVLSRLIVVLGVVCLITAFLYYIFPPLQLGRGIFMIWNGSRRHFSDCLARLFFALNRSSRFCRFGDPVGGWPAGPVAGPRKSPIVTNWGCVLSVTSGCRPAPPPA